jgi:hypothetical protein
MLECLSILESNVGAIKIPSQHGEDLNHKNLADLCQTALIQKHDRTLLIKCFSEKIMVDIDNRWPFPRIPIYYLLWIGDEEFEASIKILLDRSLEAHFAADATWGLPNFVSYCLFLTDLLELG